MLDVVSFHCKDFYLQIISEHKTNTHNTTFTFIGIVGHTYYHPGKPSTLISINMVGHTYNHLGRAHVYHFPLEGTSI